MRRIDSFLRIFTNALVFYSVIVGYMTNVRS